MILNLSELSDEPLHAQVSRQIRAKILCQDLCDGEPLPSIRGLAKEQRVSVITVQRAYDDLEREGLLRSRRGKGFWVTPLANGRKNTMAEERFADSGDGQILADIAVATQIDRHTEGRNPFLAHPIAERGGQNAARNRAVQKV